MASKIVRKTALQFGGLLAASGNIAVFGSAAAGAIGYSLDPVVIQSLVQYLQGWSAAVFGNNAPAKQDRNALDFLFSYQIGYLLSQGLAEYDPGTPYFTNGFCSEAGVVYISRVDNNLNHDPATDVAAGSGGVGNNWKTLASTIVAAVNPQSTCRAWVYFSGFNGAIITSFNVTGITVNATGDYTINFAPGVLADGNYLVQMSASNDSNQPYDPLLRFNGDLKTATQLRVRNVNGNSFAGWGGNGENYVSVFR